MTKKQDEIVPVKKKPRGGNNWLKPENMMNVEPGDNTRYLQQSMEIFNLPAIDLHTVDAVTDRINTYFGICAKYDMKPTITGFAMALNLDRRRLWELRTGNVDERNKQLRDIPSDVLDVIKKTYNMMEKMWEDYMQNGKINPVAGIFLGKNNYGYKDQTEYVLTPNTQKDEIDAEGIRKRYLLEAAGDEPGNETSET